ncbi:MAG: hypothetical protein Q7T21_03195 [Gallionella sp.]|nr:hypothetical protein [Gallionella sp.]
MKPVIQSDVLSRIRRGLLVLAVAGGMTVMAGSAYCEGDVLPPEVRAMVGMRIPAKAPGKGGDVPGWGRMGSYALDAATLPQQSLGVEELYRDNVSIFAIILLDEKDWSRTILDAQVIPQKLLWYYVKNGKFVEKKNRRLYSFNSMCKRADSETIVGLMRPESGKENCTHHSKQVMHAWKIGQQTGRITDIPAQGVSCFRGDADYSCE